MTLRLRTNRHRAAALIALMGAAVVVSGCRIGGGASENDRLRDRVAALEVELTAERRRAVEAEAKLAEVARLSEAGEGGPAAAVVRAMPRCAGIEFERLTQLSDRDGAPGYEVVDVYLVPRDGRGRFVQVAGDLAVSLVEIDSVTAEQRVVAKALLGPEALRDAYRSTLITTHYTVALGIEPAMVEPAAGSLLLIAQFSDAVTGLVHTVTKPLVVP